MPRLRRADCSGPGFTRRRRGRGFEYLDEHGRRLVDPGVLERISALAIPPAWREVWICPHPNGHLQATGIDAAGRRQYLYHERWRERRDREKFERMPELGRALPELRRAVADRLEGEGLGRERVLACGIRLLDLGFFRVGGESYAEENGTYGLATMQRRHVRLDPPSGLTFDYPAKGGKQRVQAIVDPAVYEVVSALKRRRGGEELLAWREGRAWVDVRSGDLNAFIRELTGGDFTAKDFRTWNATVLAAVSLAVASGAAASRTARRRAAVRAIREVSHYLGNTPAVCRASYVDPRVFDRFDAGITIAGALEWLAAENGDRAAEQRRVDEAVVALLEGRLDGGVVRGDPIAA